MGRSKNYILYDGTTFNEKHAICTLVQKQIYKNSEGAVQFWPKKRLKGDRLFDGGELQDKIEREQMLTNYFILKLVIYCSRV